jgi:hypothetical protein
MSLANTLFCGGSGIGWHGDPRLVMLFGPVVRVGMDAAT